MYFQDEIVQELKQLYAQLEQETEWDLSLQSLQQVIVHSILQLTYFTCNRSFIKSIALVTWHVFPLTMYPNVPLMNQSINLHVRY